MADRRPCFLYTPGLVPYPTAWDWQRELVKQRKQGSDLADVLLLLEHPPVYTLGQGANPNFLKFDPVRSPWEWHRVERGGEVTYHCPGQVVGYPILNLRFYQQDLHWYLRQLEAVIIRVLAVYGLVGTRIPGLTGVWIADRKLAAIGIKVSRWITMHGFALNVCPDLSGFDRIVPCGLTDRQVGSLAQFVPGITLEEVQREVTIAFSEVFGVRLIAASNPLPANEPSAIGALPTSPSDILPHGKGERFSPCQNHSPLDHPPDGFAPSDTSKSHASRIPR